LTNDLLLIVNHFFLELIFFAVIIASIAAWESVLILSEKLDGVANINVQIAVNSAHVEDGHLFR